MVSIKDKKDKKDTIDSKLYKTCLNEQGYILRKSKFSESIIENTKKELTIHPPYCPDYQADRPKPFKIYRENDNKLYIPRYYGIKKFGDPEKKKFDNITKISNENGNFPGSLRENQVEIVENFMKAKDECGGGIIAAGCAVGKTVMSIYLISKLKLKTLVLVNAEHLMDQWVERIEEFMPNCRIGTIQGKVCDVVDKDVVLGMIHTICNTNKQFPSYAFKGFGFVIADECHHLGASTFSQTLKRTGFKYTLGLSATPNRKDGLQNVFKNFLGDIIYKSAIVKDDAVLTRIYNYNNDDGKYNKVVLNIRKKPNNAAIITNIIKCIKRNIFIYNIIKPLLDEGRQILILTERVDHAKWFEERILSEELCTVGLYIASNKKNLKDAKNARIIVGTYLMIKEGFDCKRLDTLIMSTPTSDIEQTTGRILRIETKKRVNPALIIDICDQFSNFPGKGKRRESYYKGRGYNISKFGVDDSGTEPKITELEVQNKTKKKNNFYFNSDSDLDDNDNQEDNLISTKSKSTKNIKNETFTFTFSN